MPCSLVLINAVENAFGTTLRLGMLQNEAKTDPLALFPQYLYYSDQKGSGALLVMLCKDNSQIPVH